MPSWDLEKALELQVWLSLGQEPCRKSGLLRLLLLQPVAPHRSHKHQKRQIETAPSPRLDETHHEPTLTFHRVNFHGSEAKSPRTVVPRTEETCASIVEHVDTDTAFQEK